ncbi:MAG: HIT domain-containing protein [Candidatus Jorgensenbacteria bacterium]|nr:HIT domain-containing protein [Candidatus Jorgensenbacteria bacterium]
MACLFCAIAKKEHPADFVYEDEAVVAFADIRPSAPVHYLIAPKVHIASVMDLAEADRAVVAALIFGAKKVAEKKGLKGYKLVFNVGREGGQVIDHLHLHLLGGWENEEERKHLPIA